MEEIVFKGQNNQAMTSSLLVAEKFEKQHKDVIEAVRKLTSAENSANLSQMFAEVELPDTYGRMRPAYIMNRDGFSLLVMGFTGEKALRFKLEYIDAFNRMEQTIKTGGFRIPQTLSEALHLAASQAEQIEQQNKEIETMRPKALFADAVATSNRSCLVSELAKILQQNGIEMGQNRLFEWLRQNGYLCSKGEYYNMPSQYAVELGVIEIKKTSITKPDGVVLVSNTPKITPKGQLYFVNKFIGSRYPAKSRTKETETENIY